MKSARADAATLAAARASPTFHRHSGGADWRPALDATDEDQKDGSGQVPQLQFTENPTSWPIAQSERVRAAGALFCVGFAAESHGPAAPCPGQARAQGHSAAGGQHRSATFGQDDNEMLLVDGRRRAGTLPRADKLVLARN